MKMNEFWSPKTKKVKQQYVFYSPDDGEIEILEVTEDVEPYHSEGKEVAKGRKEAQRQRSKSKDYRAEAYQDLIDKLHEKAPTLSHWKLAGIIAEHYRRKSGRYPSQRTVYRITQSPHKPQK